jgi:hypothetical protein
MEAFVDLATAVAFVKKNLSEPGKDRPSGLEDLIVTAPMFAFYMAKLDEAAMSIKNQYPSLFDRDTERKIQAIKYHDLDSQEDLPRDALKEKFLKNVEAAISMENLEMVEADVETLQHYGISRNHAEAFFHYITQEKLDGELLEPPLSHEGKACSYTLGCVPFEEQHYFAFDGDHAFARSQGGHDGSENIQQMCKRHNIMKSNNLLFNNLTLRSILDNHRSVPSQPSLTSKTTNTVSPVVVGMLAVLSGLVLGMVFHARFF